MHIEKELHSNFRKYYDFEAVPYILDSDIENDIRYLYYNQEVSNDVAEEILKHCEQIIQTRIEDSPLDEKWLECIQLEIFAYRLFKIDKGSKGMAEHILQCNLLEITDNLNDKIDITYRKYIEDMILLLSRLVPNINEVMYYCSSGMACLYPFISDCLHLVKCNEYIENGDFIEAYEVYKIIMENLITNEMDYLSPSNFSSDKSIDIEDIKSHSDWIKLKFNKFILIAIAANKLDDLDAWLEKIYISNNYRCFVNDDIKKMKLKIRLEKFCNDDINKWTCDEVKNIISWIEGKYHIYESNTDILTLYMYCLKKIIIQTEYEEINYKDICTILLEICIMIANSHKKFRRYIY